MPVKSVSGGPFHKTVVPKGAVLESGKTTTKVIAVVDAALIVGGHRSTSEWRGQPKESHRGFWEWVSQPTGTHRTVSEWLRGVPSRGRKET